MLEERCDQKVAPIVVEAREARTAREQCSSGDRLNIRQIRSRKAHPRDRSEAAVGRQLAIPEATLLITGLTAEPAERRDWGDQQRTLGMPVFDKSALSIAGEDEDTTRARRRHQPRRGRQEVLDVVEEVALGKQPVPEVGQVRDQRATLLAGWRDRPRGGTVSSEEFGVRDRGPQDMTGALGLPAKLHLGGCQALSDLGSAVGVIAREWRGKVAIPCGGVPGEFQDSVHDSLR